MAPLLPAFENTKNTITNKNPVYGSLFEIFIDNEISEISNEIFAYKLTKNELKLFINFNEETTDIQKIIDKLLSINSIDIKMHNKIGKVLKIIKIDIKDKENYDYEIKQNYNNNELIHFKFTFKNIKTEL